MLSKTEGLLLKLWGQILKCANIDLIMVMAETRGTTEVRPSYPEFIDVSFINEYATQLPPQRGVPFRWEVPPVNLEALAQRFLEVTEREIIPSGAYTLRHHLVHTLERALDGKIGPPDRVDKTEIIDFQRWQVLPGYGRGEMGLMSSISYRVQPQYFIQNTAYSVVLACRHGISPELKEKVRSVAGQVDEIPEPNGLLRKLWFLFKENDLPRMRKKG